MKLRFEFESIQTNLMKTTIIPSLDECLNALLHEGQRLLTQTTMEQMKLSLLFVAYVVQGKP